MRRYGCSHNHVCMKRTSNSLASIGMQISWKWNMAKQNLGCGKCCICAVVLNRDQQRVKFHLVSSRVLAVLLKNEP